MSSSGFWEKITKQRIVLATKLVGLACVAGLLFGVLITPVFGGFGVAAQTAADQTSPLKLDEPPLPQKSRILAADGTTIAQFFYENRVDVPLNKVAPVMQKALVDIEDSRFYQHGALDMKGTMRALVRNQAAGNTGQGGSSLTQQYVKNVLFETAGTRVADFEDQVRIATTRLTLLKNGKKATKAQIQQAQDDLKKAQDSLDAAKKDQLITVAPKFSRKIQELRYALWVEQTYSKDDILDKYLNAVFFGHRTYGIQAAALRYFSVNASDLNYVQAATLAGMVNNATLYDPLLHPQQTIQRRNLVLDKMVEQNTISQAQADAGKKQGLSLRPKVPAGGCDGTKYGYFCQYVQDEVLNNATFGATALARQQLLNTGGLTIKTTLDRKTQDAAQRAAERASSPTSAFVTSEAMVEPGTGKIVAIAQSRPYGIGDNHTTINFAADAAHGGQMGTQAGSTFKVFTVAAALQNGYKVSQMFPTPYSTTVTGIRNCSGNGVGSWDVHNSEKTKASAEDMESATWASTNTYFAQLEKAVGLCNVMQVAKDFGMTRPDGSPLWAVPSFTLGANEIDIVHEAAAYAGFAAEGQYCGPIAITSIDQNGKALQVPSANCHQAIKADIANEVTRILKGVLTKGTAAGNYSGLTGGWEAAGKTGTTESLTTALFAGYTTSMAAVVWKGDPSGPYSNPVGEYGADMVPVWESSMDAWLSGKTPIPFTDPTGYYGTGGRSVGVPASPTNPANPGRGGKGGKKGGGGNATTGPTARPTTRNPVTGIPIP